MNLIRTNGLTAIGRVSLFVAIGALLGYIQMRLETALADEKLEFLLDFIVVLFAWVLVQCLMIIAALASWKFAVGDTYWKAPVLYFLVLLSVLLMLVFLRADSRRHSERFTGRRRATARFYRNAPCWGILLVGVMIMSEALDVFATFAFVIRAMIVRSGKWAGLVFLLIGTIAGSCLTLSVDSAATSLLQASFLLGLSALAFPSCQRSRPPRRIQTHVVEAR